MAFQEVPAGTLKPGDKVRIYGHIITLDDNKEFEFAKFDQDVIKIGEGDAIQPKQVKTGEATSDVNQGLLVKVKGKVVSKFDENSYIINDGSGDVLVFTDGYIVNQSGPVPSLEAGDTLEAVGLSGEFAQGKRIRVKDTKELSATIDKTAPITTATLNPDNPTGQNGWYTSDVTVTLAAKDEDSGVKSTVYSINDGQWKEYTEALVLSADGITKIQYHSVDNKGNIEESNMLEIKIDKTAPTVRVSVDKPQFLVPNHKMVDIKTTLSYSNDTSTIESVLESITVNEANADKSDIHGAIFGTLDTEFALRSERNGKGDGRIYTITYLVTDKAGNTTRAHVTVPKGR